MSNEKRNILMSENNYVDEIGFVRKPRDWGEVFGGVIGVSFILGVIGKIFGTVSPITGVAALFTMLVITWGIVEYGSSHKVDTWHGKHIETYIMLAGCLFVIPGIVTYYYFKARETSYLRKHKSDCTLEQRITGGDSDPFASDDDDSETADSDTVTFLHSAQSVTSKSQSVTSD